MADTYLQVRTNEEDKAAAAEILSRLGTTTSAVVNMLLKQIILTRSIPFSIGLPAEQNSRRISPFRQKDLQDVLAVIPDSVEELWVFGSTVTPYCRPQSDLDLCVIGHTTVQDESLLYKAPACAVDIVSETPEGFAAASAIPGSVYNEVRRNGVLVYKKGEHIQWQ